MRDTVTTEADHPARTACAPGDAPPDSSQRMRDFVLASADFAFETDAAGRFSYIMPDRILGWESAALIGRPATVLLVQPGDRECAGIFLPAAHIRQRRIWLKRADGGTACVSMSSTPLAGGGGRVAGARGTGACVTGQEEGVPRPAAVRRGELLDHILRQADREVLAPRMLKAALASLAGALGGEGAAVFETADGSARHEVLHEAGHGAAAVMDAAAGLLRDPERRSATSSCGRHIVVTPCRLRVGGETGLALWRTPGAPEWDQDEQLLIADAVRLLRFALEHEAIQREMSRQARTDPLTGLLNRSTFLEEAERHIRRVDYERLPGTVLFAGIDNFRALNDLLGHETGDLVLLRAATLLRDSVRPSDPVARLGGDEFAIWMGGCDQFTAAERADSICRRSMTALRDAAGTDATGISLSIGVATRCAGSGEPIGDVVRRAGHAMRTVKSRGRGSWHVTHDEDVLL